MMSAESRLATAVALLLLLFGFLLRISAHTSFTADEPTYIATGYALLAEGKAVFPILTQRGYPPLLIALEALFLYLEEPDLPITALDGWPTAYDRFLQATNTLIAPFPYVTFVARLPIIWLTLLMAAAVTRWGRLLWGGAAGLVALVVLIFDPLLLGHGSLANSDAGVVALGTLSLFAVWRYTQRPSWPRAAAAGLLLGLTLLAKLSGLLWLAAAGLLIMLAIFRRPTERRRWAPAAAIPVLALLLLWAGYGFEWGPLRGGGLPVPAPTHWANLRFLRGYTDDFFALGFWNAAGWWWYFPLAFLLKNPLPLLIGVAVGAFVLWRGPATRDRLLWLALFPALYTAVAVVERLNIGYRHMLPVHPFLYLVVAGGVVRLGAGRRFAYWAALGLGIWYVAAALVTFPQQIAYFNELVADDAYRYLSDSNISWGQNSELVADYLAEHPDVAVAPPEQPHNPAPGDYLISATALQGIGLVTREDFAWFRQREPDAVVADSWLQFEVEPFAPGWVAQCSRPAAPFADEELAAMFDPAIRRVTFDCVASWLYPAGPGVYALHDALNEPKQLCWLDLLACPADPTGPFVERRLADARLSYEKRFASDTPPFVLYEVREPQTPATGDDHPTFGGALTLLSIIPVQDGDTLSVETWWLVEQGPFDRGFSIMGHLRDRAGETLAVADGLGVSPLVLMPGDILVQRHRFAETTPDGGACLLTGVYWRDSQARWSRDDASGEDTFLGCWERPE